MVLQFRPHPFLAADDARWRIGSALGDRDIVSLVEANDPKPVRRGPYKKTEISN
jgi:hypothetical protein